MKIGYTRVSTRDQNPALQVDTLKAAGCERVYQDVAIGAKTVRPALDEMLDLNDPIDTTSAQGRFTERCSHSTGSHGTSPRARVRGFIGALKDLASPARRYCQSCSADQLKAMSVCLPILALRFLRRLNEHTDRDS
ncbi:recombinase family protein [Acidithiobacillus ferrianus]|uniref:Recombinase family protein n=1 Tax=Acidithiobacillus ferrianus TaxID=2678518 RepID=A0ACD5H9B6_9PROT|nr:recombinase family protein [Acidithiobacillus ferrianus]